MSIGALKWAVENTDCPNAQAKLVLIIYSNFANEHGRAYPSTETVSRLTGQNIKTVRTAIDALEGGCGRVPLMIDTGKRVGRTGNVKVYALAMEGVPEVGTLKGEVAPDASPTDIEARGEPSREAVPNTGGLERGAKAPVSGPKPTQKRVAEPVFGTIPLEDASASSAPRGEKRNGLNSNWTVPAIDALPDAIRAIVNQWPKGAYEAEGAGHEAHIRSRRRRGDPEAGWHARIVQLGAKPMRDAKAGLKFASPSSTGAAVATPSDRVASIDRSARMLERMGQHEDAAAMRRQAVGG